MTNVQVSVELDVADLGLVDALAYIEGDPTTRDSIIRQAVSEYIYRLDAACYSHVVKTAGQRLWFTSSSNYVRKFREKGEG